jgi:hypothetical protein
MTWERFRRTPKDVNRDHPGWEPPDDGWQAWTVPT